VRGNPVHTSICCKVVRIDYILGRTEASLVDKQVRLGYLADEQSTGMTMELYWKLKALANLAKKATSH